MITNPEVTTTGSWADPDLAPTGVVLLSNRPLAMARHILPTLKAQGLAVALGAAPEGFDLADVLPAPWQHLAHQIVALAEDAGIAQRAAQLGFGLVAGFGSGGRAQKLAGAGAEIVLTAPAELANGRLSQAFARKFIELPDALDLTLPLPTSLRQRPGLILDAGCLAGAQDTGTLRERLLKLADRMPIALLGGACIAGNWRELTERGVTVVDGSGMALAPDGLQTQARQRLERVARLLDRLPDMTSGENYSVLPFCLRVHGRTGPGADGAGLRRGLMRVLSQAPGMELREDGDGFLLYPALRWTLADAAGALFMQWGAAWGKRRALYVGGDVEHEVGLHALRGEGTGVRISDRPVPTSASLRIRSAGLIPALLDRLD